MFYIVLCFRRWLDVPNVTEFNIAALDQFIASTKPEVRRWSDMVPYFQRAPESSDDPIIYLLYALPHGGHPTDLMVVLTVLNPGHIRGEFFHTKGHFHRPDGAEYVIALEGTGLLERGFRDGSWESSRMVPGQHMLVASGQAHRVVNTGTSPLVFVSICSPAVGHDYESVTILNWYHPRAGERSKQDG